MYRLSLTDAELKSLGWVANRYHSAQILYDALDEEYCVFAAAREETSFTIQEHNAWEYMDALDEEDGGGAWPPCIGGTLAHKLLDFWHEII